MASVLQDACIADHPDPSVQEVLSKETRLVAPALCQEFNDSLGTEDLDKERYCSGEFYRLEPRMEPPARGFVFRCLELEPESQIADLDEAARAALMRETLASLSAEHVAVDTTRHPGIHRTRSIDYVGFWLAR